MRFKLSALFSSLMLLAAGAGAGTIDMDDPLRALGRENDVRVDAQLASEAITPGMAIGVTYQIENFSALPIAIAPRAATATFDDQTGSITVAIGCEVPEAGKMPQLEVIAPGEKKVFKVSATPAMNVAAIRARLVPSPRSVQMKVSILRNIDPFMPIITTRSNARLSDELFEKWFEAAETILLNALPVHYAPRNSSGSAERQTGF